jgi:hypothetical protein
MFAFGREQRAKNRSEAVICAGLLCSDVVGSKLHEISRECTTCKKSRNN